MEEVIGEFVATCTDAEGEQIARFGGSDVEIFLSSLEDYLDILKRRPDAKFEIRFVRFEQK